MQRHFSYPLKYNKNGKVYVKAEGVKWLNEKYFRKSYLEELENYKLALQKAKKIRHNFDFKETITKMVSYIYK